MFINPVNSDQLASSVQRDYLRAAEAHRQAKDHDNGSRKLGAVSRVGIVVTSLVVLVSAIMQFANV